MNAPAPKTIKGRKYDQVLDGALRVFLQHGFANANMDEVARQSQVSKATVYNYFPDKEHLFFEVVKFQCQCQADSAIEVIDQTAPVAETLTQAAYETIRLMQSTFSQRMFRICVAEADRFPELGRFFYESGPLMGRHKLAAYFREATAKGELVIDDFELAADQFAELCKADWWPRFIFGISVSLSQAEVDRIVKGAVSTFMHRYGS